MAKTPVSMTIDGYKEREVLMVTYEFNQATDVEGQMAGIPRGGKITVRVKALNDGTPDLLAWMTERSLPKNGEIKFLETKTNKELRGEVGGQDGSLRGDHHHLQADRVRQREVRERLGLKSLRFTVYGLQFTDD